MKCLESSVRSKTLSKKEGCSVRTKTLSKKEGCWALSFWWPGGRVTNVSRFGLICLLLGPKEPGQLAVQLVSGCAESLWKANEKKTPKAPFSQDLIPSDSRELR